MKYLIIICSMLLFLISIVTSSRQMGVMAVETSLPNWVATESEITNVGQDEKILSNDHAVAKAALDEAIAKRDFDRVRFGLASYFLSYRITAAKALRESGQKRFVPFLADALEANRAIISGGTETQIRQNDLTLVLVKGIEQLTNLDLGLGPKPTDARIVKAVEKTRRWCRKQLQSK